MPMDDEFRYTHENPYIGKGLGRNTVKGKEYTKVEADVAEFEDTFFTQAYNGGINKCGLGVDEFCDATINFSRKNYADLMPDGKTKKVGNTIKSRKMSGYLEEFIDNGVNLLLHGKGQEFIEEYYTMIGKIYNYQIPLKEIASKGKIKKTIKDYIADCNTVTKAGSKKSRQAWYELVIKEGVKVDLNDTIYYVNCGTKKSHSDVKRITHQYTIINGEEVEIDGKVKKEILLKECEKKRLNYDEIKSSTKTIKDLITPHITREYDEILLNCKRIPNEIVDSEKEVYCSDIDLEYNVTKYIDQFNKRVRPLMVCFKPSIREKIMVENPDDRNYFTSDECELDSGHPIKETDQDTYDALMTLDRKEVEFWDKIGEKPPFIDECGIDWKKTLAEFREIKKMEEDAIFQEENEKYLKAIDSITKEEALAFEQESIIPKRIGDIVELGSDLHFTFKKLKGVRPSSGGFIFDDIVYNDKSEEEYESAIAASEAE